MALVEDTGLDAVLSGPLSESWRQQPGAPCYCTDLTREEMPAALASAERTRLSKRREIVMDAILERFGERKAGPDSDYEVRLTRAVFM
ncbi:NADP oxidoreductase [Tianweitania aestuarii]|uniref:NADP oxidoreductase n=1 Tax=Tianweitania aestuarii TaxID=2814886 RepID=UPI0032635BCE